MSALSVTAVAWLAVLAITASAVLFGQGARAPSHPARGVQAGRRHRIGTALSISGPIGVLLIAVAAGAMAGSWLTLAVIAFAAVGFVAVAGLVLAPH
ncbi:MAG: hypothetical protein M3446_04495 [Actinomycetota bacterium]|nr:hypothetical protein [Actinomycetota bacterium]